MKFIAFLIALFVAIGCKPTQPATLPVDKSKVTIIFTNAPDQSKDMLIGSTVFPEETINYINSDTLNVRYIPKSIGNDTLTIPTFDGYAELWHKVNGRDKAMWLLQGGDTVSITYNEKGRPYLKSIISDDNTRLYNLPWENEYAIHSKASYSLKFIINDATTKAIYKRYHNNLKNIPDLFANAYFNIDSLQIIYTAYIDDFQTKIDSLATLGEEQRLYAKWYKRHYIENGWTLNDVLACDSLLRYPSGVKALYYYRNGMKSTNLFDKVESDTSLSRIARENLLREAIIGIQNSDYWTALPDKVITEYTERYIAITGDSSAKPFVVKKPNVTEVNGYTYDLVLLGLDSKQYDFSEILSKFKGKIVYVDLWASWCAPCKAGMPAALKLREAYQGKDIIFLYLAVNDRESAWRKEVKSCKTDYLGENYLILNTDESQFLKEINHNLIPRFLIFDRNGYLVDTDAPRAGDTKINDTFSKYLN